MSLRPLPLLCILAQLAGCASERPLRDELAALRLQLQSERQRDEAMRRQLAEVHRLLEEQRRRVVEQQRRLEQMQRSLDAQDLVLRKLEDRGSGTPPGDAGPSFASVVRVVGPDRYRIKRAALAAVLADSSKLAQGARIVPAMRDGRPSGFRIFAIRAGSFYQAIGLSNGDTIERINGAQLTSPDRALEAYAKVRNAKQLAVEIVRRGQRKTLHYTID